MVRRSAAPFVVAGLGLLALGLASQALGDDLDEEDDEPGAVAAGADAGGAQAADGGPQADAEPEIPLAPPHPVGTDPMQLPAAASTSVGGPNTGRLSGGVPLPSDAPGLRSNPNRPNRDAFYGTVELVRALVRSAAAVHTELPGGSATVNDIGLPQGGRIPHHGSHRAGRDVDVLFFLLDRRGRPRTSVAVPLDPQGRGWIFNNLASGGDDVRVRLDARRTWRFVRAMLEDEEALVQRIYVAEHVRSLLLREARRSHAPLAVRRRFEDSTCQPGPPHDDHLHFRLFCTPQDMVEGRCTDTPPIYPWRRAQLRATGLDPAMQVRIRRPRGPRMQRPRVASAPRRSGGGGGLPREVTASMHSRAAAFLALRETWLHPPRTGRSYCR